MTSPITKKAIAARAQASAKDKQKPMKQRGKAKTANQVPKGKGAAKKKAASAQPADVLTERQKLDAQLSRRAQRRIVSNPYVAGHCYFEALSLSNSFTIGMGDKAGAKLIRAVLGKAYLDTALQENLKKWVLQRERALAPSFSSHVAAAADAAALLAGQDVASQWQPAFFSERSQMMTSTNCGIPTGDLWIYNIGTDTDTYPLVFFRPLVTIGLYPVSAVRSVPLYFFSVQALRLNFASAQKDALSDFRRAGEVGDQLRSCIRSEYDSLKGETDLSFEEWAVVRVKQTSKNDLIESATGLFSMYKACTSFELSLRGKFEASAKKTKAGNVGAVRPGESVAVNIETSVHLVLNVLAFVIPKYVSTFVSKVDGRPEEMGLIPFGSTVISHNGINGVMGHFESTEHLRKSMKRLGALVSHGKKKAGSTLIYNRNAVKEKWFTDFWWLRQRGDELFCACCNRFPALRARDSIGQGDMPAAKARQDALRRHDSNSSHAASARMMEKQQSGGVGGLLERHVSVSSGRTVVCRILRTVHSIVLNDIAFSKLGALCQMQESNGLQMGGSAYKNNTFYDGAIGAMASFYELKHTECFLKNIKKSAMWFAGDGSGSIRNQELEIAYVGTYDFDQQKAVVGWWDISVLDLTKSRDGASPDAPAIFATQMSSFERRLGTGYLDIIRDCTAAVSFDGASVMIGKENSVATRWLDIAPQALCFHAVAHRLESAYADACSEVAFMLFLGELLQDVYVLFNASMKQCAGMKEMASVLDETLVSAKPLHGIRWLASQVRAVSALLHNYKTLVAHLEKVAFVRVGCALMTTSPSAEFVGKKISLVVQSEGGVVRTRTGRIARVVTNSSGGNAASSSRDPALDSLLIKFERASGADASEQTVTKNVATLALAASKERELANVKEWDLHLALTQYRTVITLHFIYDIETTLKFLSLAFQGEDLTPSSLEQGLNRTLEQLEEMKTVNGKSLAKFYQDFDQDTEEFEGFNLEDREKGQDMFDLDRRDLLESVVLYIHGRFDSLLANPVLLMLRNSLEHRRWPPKGDAALDDWGNEELAAFANHYSGLESLRDFDIKEALHQWRRLKQEISGEPFFSLSYKKFWEHMSTHYDTAQEYCELLKLPRISLVLLPDTSCAERGYSSYNRFHTAARANLKIGTARNVFAIKNYGPPSGAGLHVEELYDEWMGLINSEASSSSGGVARNPQRRNVAALLRKMMAAANSRHDNGETGDLI